MHQCRKLRKASYYTQFVCSKTQALILQIGVKYLIRYLGGEYGERGKYNH
jgi:hypothetical protein